MYVAANRFRASANRARTTSASGWWRVKAKPWLQNLIERPDSSTAAAWLHTVIVGTIIVSSITFCIETIPELTHYNTFWAHLEIFFVVVFTFELVARYAITDQTTCEFFSEMWTVLDVLALLPFYCAAVELEFPTGAIDSKTGTPDTAPLPDMRILRMFRLLRVFKLARHGNKQLGFVFEGLSQSKVSFLLLFTMLGLALIFFSFLAWATERGEWDERENCYRRENEPHYTNCSPFENVFMSFWWGITTITTVGYGDAYPLSVSGKIVTSFAMITGLLCVALPTTQLGLEFSAAYSKGRTERAQKKARKSIMMCSREEIMLVDELRKLDSCRKTLADGSPFLEALFASREDSYEMRMRDLTPRTSSKQKAVKKKVDAEQKNVNLLVSQADSAMRQYRHFLLTSVSKGNLKGESQENIGDN
ncbi:unnamed protein product [Amoebophrya sp. A120]|nr:unnamed protein product [Amoebophrya sp. A120]|eukprot:GSA120T00011083001.1